MLQLKVTPVVGLPQFTGWSQVSESTVSASVRLILVFAISGKHAGNVGRDINEKVSDFYFYDVEQLYNFLQELVNFVHSQECKIYFSCAALGRNLSIFATYGGSIFLKRAEKSGKILTSDFEVKIVEGTYVENDIFVLTTLQADQFLNEIQLKFQQGYDVDIIITSVVPGLHSQGDSSLSALVFIDKELEKNKTKNFKEVVAPFVELEEEQKIQDNLTEIPLTQEKYSNNVENNTHESLAKVSFEVDSLQIPGFFKKIVLQCSSILKIIILSFKKLFILLFSFFKKILLFLGLKLKNFNLKKIINLISKIKRNGLKSIFKSNKQYISEVKPKKGLWKFVLIALILLTVFGVVGYFSYQNKKEQDYLQLLLDPIILEVSNSKELLSSDPIKTRQVISSAIEKVSTLETENKDSSAVELLSNSKKEWIEYLESISGSEELQELDIFYDLRLAKSDFISTGIDINDKKLVLFDKDMRQVLLLDYNTKQVSIRDLSQKEVLLSVVLQDNTVFTLVDGIYKFSSDLDSETDIEEVRGLGDSNRTATLLDAYDRFVYVINPEKRNIYRYSQTEDGYSEPVGWMKSATGLKYDELLSIAVDGDVWLTTNDGQLKKFTSGREETFVIRGLEILFEEDIYVYTNENLENLYILDSNNHRVVVLSKNGDFIKEFKSVSLGAASNIAVNEDLKKVFIVSGSIIYQIGL